MIEQSVLFADIAGSTRLYTEKGDDFARQLLMQTVGLMGEVVRAGGGRVIERIGDEILCVFEEPDTAAWAAADLHLRVTLARVMGTLSEAMRIRVGFTHGPVVESDDGIFGSTVHRASRLCSHAKAGQTLTDGETLEQLDPALRENARFHRSAVLKGQSGECDMHELVWTVGNATLTAVPRKRRERATAGVRMEYAGRRWVVDAGRPQLEIGRHGACDVQIDGRTVSHLHARVTWNAGHVWLEDLSTNGTMLEPEDGGPVRVHHERVPLRGCGVLRLGVEPDEDETGVPVRYECA